VKKWRALPELAAHVTARRIGPDDEPWIERAVTLHCLPSRLEPAHDDARWPLVALLKDADGLDRVRLGDVDPSYLRHPESHNMIDFAETLFKKTHGRVPEGPGHFARLVEEAGRIAGQEVVVPEGLG
jgi:hypothetical protein